MGISNPILGGVHVFYFCRQMLPSKDIEHNLYVYTCKSYVTEDVLTWNNFVEGKPSQFMKKWASSTSKFMRAKFLLFCPLRKLPLLPKPALLWNGMPGTHFALAVATVLCIEMGEVHGIVPSVRQIIFQGLIRLQSYWLLGEISASLGGPVGLVVICIQPWLAL